MVMVPLVWAPLVLVPVVWVLSVVVERFLTLSGLENFVRTNTYVSMNLIVHGYVFTYNFAQNFVRTSPDVRIRSTTPDISTIFC